MQNTKKYLGARIQEIRKQKNIKQTELAEMVGIDSKHMSKIECGRCFPSFELLDKIAYQLNTPVEDFLKTKHLHNREELLKEIISGLENTNDEKFQLFYKLYKDII